MEEEREGERDMGEGQRSGERRWKGGKGTRKLAGEMEEGREEEGDRGKSKGRRNRGEGSERGGGEEK